MSRRPADKAAQHQQTIKGLLKLEANKNCADCKRNKHPRWASWNLGIFICIRCSGIHRGMGTHISRVKSVDLDAWTDEQLQSVLRWGNARANKYWEAKLAPGHVPSDAKIENFIRTKYESRRWVMEGPMPDPSTLDVEGDDDVVPLNIVQEKAKLDRSSSQKASSPSQAPPQSRKPEPSFDLIGGDDMSPPPARPSTTDTPSTTVRPPPQKQQHTQSQLLGGLGGDFFGGPPERPASASSKPAGMSRPDLKQSILSLYASTPKPQPQPAQSAQPQHGRQPSFGAMQGSSSGNASSSAFGGLNDAFSGLSFGSTSSAPPSTQVQNQQQPKSSAFSGFGAMSPPTKAQPAPPQVTNPPPLAGGGFFDTGPKPPPKQAPKTSTAPPPLSMRKTSNASDGFGEFSSALNPVTASSVATSSNGLLDLSSGPNSAATKSANPVASNTSVFNLSAPKAPSNYDAVMQSSAPPTKTSFANNSSNPWGSNAWSTAEPAMATPQTGMSLASPSLKSATGADFGWGSSPLPTNATSASAQSDWGKPASTASTVPATTQPDWGSTSNAAATDTGEWGSMQSPSTEQSGFGGFGSAPAPAPPKVMVDEDFGDWGSAPAAPAARSTGYPNAAPAPKLNGGEDLFSNVWE